MKAQMSHATEPDLEEGDRTHHMEDAVNQIRLQRQRQRKEKAELEKMEEMECDQFLGEHGIDIADLSFQEKQDIRRALQISTQDLPGPSHTFARSLSPQPSTSGFSSHAFRRNPSPVRSWNDSDDDFSENRLQNRTPQSRVACPIPQRKRPSPEGDNATGAKAVRLKANFYNSNSQTPLLTQINRRSVPETPPVKPLYQQKPRLRLLDQERPFRKEEVATKSSSGPCDFTVIEDDVNGDVSILGESRGPRMIRRKLQLSDNAAAKSETVTSGSAMNHQSAKKPSRTFTSEELEIVEQFTEELSWKPDCRKLKRKYRTSRARANKDEYQWLLKGSASIELIYDFWDRYFRKLRREQSKVSRQLEWGPPVLPGKHHSRTLDRKLRGEESFTWSEGEEEEAEDAQVPETDIWKPAKCHLTRSGKGGRGVKARPVVEEAEVAADAVAESRKDPIPLPGPSSLPVSDQVLYRGGRIAGVTSMDYHDFLSECDVPASSQRGGGDGDAILATQSSASDIILNSQGDIYSTQFPRRRNRTFHVADESNDSVSVLPRISKRNRLEMQHRTATATMSCSDSVFPTRKKSRTQESSSSGSQRVPSPPVDLEMDCIAVENNVGTGPDMFALDDNEEAERQDFSDYLSKMKEVRTYSRRRPVATVSFAKMVEGEEEKDQNNLFNASTSSYGSQPSRSQVQQEDSEDEVQLLSPLSEGQEEEMASARKMKGRIPRRRILQPLMEEDADARDTQGQDFRRDEREEENHDSCTLIPCPMCQREFLDTEIEVHAAYCNGPDPEPERMLTRRIRESRASTFHAQDPETDQDQARHRESWMDKEQVTCMICDRQFPDNGPAFKKHLNQCEVRAAARARQLEGVEAMVVEDGASSNPPSTRSRAGAACQ